MGDLQMVRCCVSLGQLDLDPGGTPIMRVHQFSAEFACVSIMGTALTKV